VGIAKDRNGTKLRKSLSPLPPGRDGKSAKKRILRNIHVNSMMEKLKSNPMCITAAKSRIRGYREPRKIPKESRSMKHAKAMRKGNARLEAISHCQKNPRGCPSERTIASGLELHRASQSESNFVNPAKK